MKRIIKSLVIVVLLFASTTTFSQTDWKAPADADAILSHIKFTEEISQEGAKTYSSSCVSCHGTPSQGNYTPMVPPPGDVAGTDIQNQSDGSLYYKIRQGKGAMPGFTDALSEEEVWQLVSYIRSFNPSYTQEMPNMEGIEIPELVLTLEFDDNVDKLVVKVSDENGIPQEGASVSAFVEGMFGNHLVGKSKTNELGIAWFDFDSKIPGDQYGNIQIQLKATKGYGSANLSQKLQAAAPTIKKSAIEGRHLWSKARKAPIWMIIIFNLIGIGIWGAIIYIIIGLRRIKKLQ